MKKDESPPLLTRAVGIPQIGQRVSKMPQCRVRLIAASSSAARNGVEASVISSDRFHSSGFIQVQMTIGESRRRSKTLW
jgi:hypothetical protein